MRMRPVQDGAALLARAGVGAVFAAHGWKKIQAGIDATSREFHTLHVPLPTAAAVYATFVELLGGVALVLGVALPVAGVLLFLDMLGALVFVNGKHGLLMTGHAIDPAHQGYELVLVLGLVSLLFAVGGGGRFTLDHWLLARRKSRPSDDEDDLSRPFLPEADSDPWRPAVPATTAPAVEAPAEDPPAPRLASDIVSEPARKKGAPASPGDPTQDVLVAGRRFGRRKPSSPGSSSSPSPSSSDSREDED